MKYKITGLGWRKILIDKVSFEQDVLVTPSAILYRNRKPSKKYSELYGHTPLSREEVTNYIDFIRGSDTVVIGNGFQGRMVVMVEAVNELLKDGLEVVVEDTPSAVATFNKMVSKGFKVCGLFHLTC